MLGILEDLLAIVLFIQLMAWLSHRHLFDSYFNPICLLFLVVYVLRRIQKS